MHYEGGFPFICKNSNAKMLKMKKTKRFNYFILKVLTFFCFGRNINIKKAMDR